MNGLALYHALRRPQTVAGLVFAVASLAVLGFVFLTLWQPAQRSAVAAVTSVERLRQSIAVLEMADRLADGYAARLAEVETLEGKLKMPTNDPEFVRNLEQLASKSSAVLQQVSSRPVIGKEQKIRGAVFEFQVNGSYPALKQFLVSIQALPEFVAVEQVLFELGDKDVRARVVIKRIALQG